MGIAARTPTLPQIPIDHLFIEGVSRIMPQVAGGHTWQQGAHMRHFFLYIQKNIPYKNIPGRAHLVVFHWFHKGWSHFRPFFGPVLAKYVGRRNEMDAFEGHFFSIYLIFHWFYNRIGVI